MQTNFKLLLVVGLLVVAGAVGGGLVVMQLQKTKTGEKVGTEITEQAQPDEDAEVQQMTQTSRPKPVVADVKIISPDIQGYVFSKSVAGADATLLNHTTQFNSTDKLLWLTVRFSEKSQATKVNFSMVYNQDGSILGPAQAQVKIENGVKFAVFKLASPAKGWPVGYYTGLISLPSGEDQRFDFRIQ